MDPLTPEYIAELGRQLASIAAFLGGFSITFFGTLLTIKCSRGIMSWALSSAAIAAGAFAVTVISTTMLITSLHPGTPSDIVLQGDSLFWGRFTAALSLFLGTTALLLSLALSGWIHSRRVGVTTTLVALISWVTVIWALIGFRFTS